MTELKVLRQQSEMVLAALDEGVLPDGIYHALYSLLTELLERIAKLEDELDGIYAEREAASDEHDYLNWMKERH